MSEPDEFYSAADELAALLKQRNLRIVFAESCTGGLVSAVLAGIPGISANHCGSAVVYRIETKAEWLGISREMLRDPGPVSREVAQAMAEGVLRRTPEAEVAVSITGHLGPDAPADQDGLLYIGLAARSGAWVGSGMTPQTQAHRLDPSAEPAARTVEQFRRDRQREAARRMLVSATHWLRNPG